MGIIAVFKIILAMIFQIEASPIILLGLGFTKIEVYFIVMILSFIMVMINISILELGISVLSKPRTLGHSVALIIHKWELPGLFLAGIIPWPPIIGAAQPLAYILYCRVENKIWYKPNPGMLSLGFGILIKMFIIIRYI